MTDCLLAEKRRRGPDEVNRNPGSRLLIFVLSLGYGPNFFLTRNPRLETRNGWFASKTTCEPAAHPPRPRRRLARAP